jgi:hypothetical protein
MSEENDRYQLRSLVEVSIPRPRPWLLNEEQYQILHVGDPGELKAWLFLCIGLFAGSMEAIFSTIQSVDWPTALAKRNYMPAGHLLVQIFFGAAALAGGVICCVMLRRKGVLCSDLKTRISEHFASAPDSSEAQATSEPQGSADASAAPVT